MLKRNIFSLIIRKYKWKNKIMEQKLITLNFAFENSVCWTFLSFVHRIFKFSFFYIKKTFISKSLSQCEDHKIIIFLSFVSSYFCEQEYVYSTNRKSKQTSYETLAQGSIKEGVGKIYCLWHNSYSGYLLWFFCFVFFQHQRNIIDGVQLWVI